MGSAKRQLSVKIKPFKSVFVMEDAEVRRVIISNCLCLLHITLFCAGVGSEAQTAKPLCVFRCVIGAPICTSARRTALLLYSLSSWKQNWFPPPFYTSWVCFLYLTLLYSISATSCPFSLTVLFWVSPQRGWSPSLTELDATLIWIFCIIGLFP